MTSPGMRIVEPSLGIVAVGDAMRWTGLGGVVAAVLGLVWMLAGALLVETSIVDDGSLVDAVSRGSGIGIIATGVAGGLVAAVGWVAAVVGSPRALERALAEPDAAPTTHPLALASSASWRIPIGLVLAVVGPIVTFAGFALHGDLPAPWSFAVPSVGIAMLVGMVLCFRRVLAADLAWKARVDAARSEAARRRSVVDREEAERWASMDVSPTFPASLWHLVAGIDLAAGRIVAFGTLALLLPLGLAGLHAIGALPDGFVVVTVALLLLVILAVLTALVAFAGTTAWAERATARWSRRAGGVVVDDVAIGAALSAPRAASLGALALGCVAGFALLVGVAIATAGPVADIPVPPTADPVPALVAAVVLAVAATILASADAPLARRDRAELRVAAAPGDVRMPTTAELRRRRIATGR